MDSEVGWPSVLCSDCPMATSCSPRWCLLPGNSQHPSQHKYLWHCTQFYFKIFNIFAKRVTSHWKVYLFFIQGENKIKKTENRSSPCQWNVSWLLVLNLGAVLQGYFTFWVVLSMIWGLIATAIAIVMPLAESWETLWAVAVHTLQCNPMKKKVNKTTTWDFSEEKLGDGHLWIDEYLVMKFMTSLFEG